MAKYIKLEELKDFPIRKDRCDKNTQTSTLSLALSRCWNMPRIFLPSTSRRWYGVVIVNITTIAAHVSAIGSEWIARMIQSFSVNTA